MTNDLTRRGFLTRLALFGCCAAASPLLPGMDGLDVVQPWGAPEYASLRSGLKGGPVHWRT